MPFTSTQISGLVGGQQVMFANQATFANQVTGESGSQQMMANPYPSPSYGVAGLDPASPDIGTKIAGGGAMAMGGLAAGGTMAASLLGYKNPLGLLDPFTGISRAFGAGTGGGMMARAGVMAGTEGMGLGYAASNISGAFASGGMRAGLGALGGGLAGAAVAAVPYYIAGKAAEYVGKNVYEGVQNFQDVRRMSAQYMEPQYGQPGASLGGRAGAGMIKNITSFMHEMASEDVMTSMKDMRQLMDRAGSMGMMQGIQDVNQFKQRFKDIVRQTKGVAQILGTTLQEALPVVNQLQQMGMWTAKDVLGTSAAIKAAGPGGAAAMMGSMQQGAQMAYQMGGKLESGARLGQELFGQVGAAVRTGTLSQQDIRNFTGGVGGAEGQRMVAGGMQQVFAGFGQTAMGRMMMAGLGEVKNGEFTGQMNQELMDKFKRGEISVDELQRRGQQRVQGNQNTAASFFNKAETLGQEMASQGGMVGLAQATQQALVKAGRAGAPSAIQNRFIQMITGANQRQADMIQKIIKDLPRIMDEQERANSAALEDSFRQLDEQRNKSLSGLGAAVSKAVEEGVGRPLQELGENLTSSMSEATQRFTDKLYGRTRAMPHLGVEQKMMLGRAGALTSAGRSYADLGIQNIGQGYMQGGFMENMIGRVGEQGFGGRLLTGMGIGAGIGAGVGAMAAGVGALPGAALGAVIGGAEVMMGVGDQGSPRMRALQAAGLRGNKPEDAVRVARQAYARTVDPTMGGLLGGETEKKRSAMETVKARMREVYNNPENANRLRELGETNPSAQFDEISRLLKADPKTKAAFDTLEGASAGGRGAVDSTMNVVAVSQAELSYTGKHAFDPVKLTQGLGVPGSPKEIEEFRQKNIQMMTEAAGGFSWKGLSKAAGVGAAGGFVLPIPGGALLGGLVGAAHYMMRDKTSEATMQAAMASTKFLPSDILEVLKKGKDASTSNRFSQALSGGNTEASNIQKAYMAMTEEQKATFMGNLEVEGAIKENQYREKTKEQLKTAAERTGPILSIQGVNKKAASEIEKARKSLASGDIGSAEATLEHLATSGQLKESEVNRLLSGGGGVAGMQAGRIAKVKGLKELTAESAQGTLGNLGGAGLMMDPQIAQEVEQMLARGHGKIKGNDLEKLKKDVLTHAERMMPAGAGDGKTASEQAQEKYIAAMNKFSDSVNRLAPAKTQDVKNETVLTTTAEGAATP